MDLQYYTTVIAGDTILYNMEQMESVDGVRISISLSYVCLFFVLMIYKYEVVFRSGVIIVALLGLWWPFLFTIPYILVLWRYYVGLNVSTEQSLFIAQSLENMEESDSANTTNHWAVVVQQGERFLYTHAVGAVASGKGKKKPFKEMDQATLEGYRLTHVGYVTRVSRAQKMRELVADEPMPKSGYTCQEFAVDIAFQLSSSRTFTFMRMLLLWRIRTMSLGVIVAISVTLQILDYPLAKLLNIFVLTNLFVAMELARIGVHNQPQGRILPVFKAYLNYPTKKNFLQLFLVVSALIVFYLRIGLLDTLMVLIVIMAACTNFQVK